MDFLKVLSERKAIRKYKKDEVSQEKLERLFYALSVAPSSMNQQPYKFIFVKNSELRKEIVRRACHQEFLYDAPVLMIAACEAGKEFDTALAVENVALAATNEGLSTCCVGWFERDILKEIISFKNNYEPCIILAIGYGDEVPEPKEKKSIEELIYVI